MSQVLHAFGPFCLWQCLLFVPMHLVGSGCVSDAPLGASSLVVELFRELATINSLQIMMKISQLNQIEPSVHIAIKLCHFSLDK